MNTFNDRNSEFIKFVHKLFNKNEVTVKMSMSGHYVF